MFQFIVNVYIEVIRVGPPKILLMKSNHSVIAIPSELNRRGLVALEPEVTSIGFYINHVVVIC